jgi:hypothetical protein
MSTADAVNTIIDSLNEHDEQPRKQIAEIVDVLGADVSLALLAETRKVQDTGGIEVRDGTRRRTDGGVFFSLAKSKLPKADRNRIFRVKPPPRPEDAANGSPSTPPPAAPAPVPVVPVAAPVGRREEPRARPAPVQQSLLPQRQAAPPPQRQVELGGRRRVVEVEVLRHSPKPAAAAPESHRSAPRAAPAPAPEPQRTELRPVRRIVTVAAPPKEEPLPSTPDAARERVKGLLRELNKAEQRKVLLDLLEGVGGLPKPPEPRREAKPPPPPPPPPPPQPTPPPARLDATGRERVLAAVTEALGLSASDLARVLYNDDAAGPRAKARAVLERYKRSR